MVAEEGAFVNMESWDAIDTQAAPTYAPGGGGNNQLPRGKKSMLQWLSITLVTGNFNGNRHLYWPFKSFMWDPPDRTTKIAIQTKSKTNVYFWGIGMPYSDSQDWSFRTFPIPDQMEMNAELLYALPGFDPHADSWVNIVGIVWPTDQFYVDWCYKVTDVNE